MTAPSIRLYKALEGLSPDDRKAVSARLERWLSAAIGRHLGPLVAIVAAAQDAATPGPLRALYAPLGEAGGLLLRGEVEAVVAAVDRPLRSAVAKQGIRIGTLDIFVPALLRPEPVRWRLALAAAFAERPMVAPPPAGAVSLPTPDDPDARHAAMLAGFRVLGTQMLRVDMIERLARIAHEGRGRRGLPFAPDLALATSLGLQPASFARLMTALGFRPMEAADGAARWTWRGPPDVRRPAPPARPARANAFAVLAELTGGVRGRGAA